MSTPQASILRLCNFEGPLQTIQPYFCYHNEVCCKDGCCSKYEYKFFQTWNFWYKIYIVLGVIILFLLYRYFCYYCKRNGAIRRENTLNIVPPSNPRRNEVSSRMVNFMVTYNNRNNLASRKTGTEMGDPPPLYNVAVHLPKPAIPANTETITNHDQVPTYEQATQMK